MHSFRNEFFTCLFKIQNVQVIQNDVIKCCKMMSSNVALLHSNNCFVLEPAICEDLDLHVVIFLQMSFKISQFYVFILKIQITNKIFSKFPFMINSLKFSDNEIVNFMSPIKKWRLHYISYFIWILPVCYEQVNLKNNRSTYYVSII